MTKEIRMSRECPDIQDTRTVVTVLPGCPGNVWTPRHLDSGACVISLSRECLDTRTVVPGCPGSVGTSRTSRTPGQWCPCYQDDPGVSGHPGHPGHISRTSQESGHFGMP